MKVSEIKGVIPVIWLCLGMRCLQRLANEPTYYLTQTYNEYHPKKKKIENVASGLEYYP